MGKHAHTDDELQEIHEYLALSRELDAIRAIEAAEFIQQENSEEVIVDGVDANVDDDMDDDMDDDDASVGEHQNAPAVLMDDIGARRTYWQAQSLVDLEVDAFQQALAAADVEAQQNAYYRLAVYHGRTLYILRSSLTSGKEALAQAAMRNLTTLHRAMMQMHGAAPHHVPVALVLDRSGRDDFARDLVMRSLQESHDPLSVDEVVRCVNDLDVMGVAAGTVQRHLKDLVDSGYVEQASQRPTTYTRSARAYTDMNVNTPALRALVGPALHAQLTAAGYADLHDVAARPSSFRQLFGPLTGLGTASGALFVDLVETLLDDRAEQGSPWRHFDLIGSAFPRPYQQEAYAVFRGYGYHGQLVEAPTGSGKTLIGMMCIQDWLRSLRAGQSILVLVPTSNYLQQWAGELCYKRIGLNLSPELVFTGTPGQLERFQKRTGSHPAVLLMTYTALAQAGSAVGKGGFDVDSIEMFLQGANVQAVILDEVHKVVENLNGVSADVIRLMLTWLEDGSLQRLIGFTGTAEAYRSRFEKLGLQLVYTIPIDELIAAGFVAPFAELGAPFAYSARERRIHDLLDQYKEHLLVYLERIGGERLRSWFAQIPMDERVAIGHDLLNMYQARKDWSTALARRFVEWETGGSLQLSEINLVTIVQIANRWNDVEMARRVDMSAPDFSALVSILNDIKDELATLVFLPTTLNRLREPGFAFQFSVDALRAAFAGATNQAMRNEAVKDGLATNIAGLYTGVTDWYRRVGEGRVETIKAIIEAEQTIRTVSGVIVFDNARRIHWQEGVAVPGYEGVGGLFAQMLGDDRYRPYAVLSGEQYLPYDEDDPLPPRIANFVSEELMQTEIGGAMFNLVFQGVAVEAEIEEALRLAWRALIVDYSERLHDVHAARPGDFSRHVLRPMRNRVRRLDLGSAGERALARMDLRNVHFADLVNTFFDYAIIARYFRQAKVAELEQVSGARRKFFVVPMATGNRKLLMYDLTARIVDAESLPINVVIVSTWARTGWNVIAPNVLIDATATRDVTAWQQLRGRAIRARRTWTNDCYRLITALIGSQLADPLAQDGIPDDVAETMRAERNGHQPAPSSLDGALMDLLGQVTSVDTCARVRTSGLSSLTDDERTGIAIALMRRYNKVTHIYELVKAYGSTSQVIFERSQRAWQRREHIAAKHDHEVAVNPLDGYKSTGVEHAPLVYAQDPRMDVPAALAQRLVGVLDGSDDRIVSGWLQLKSIL